MPASIRVNENSKKVLIALPVAFLDEIDLAAHVEHRTRSDFIREAIRFYLYHFKKRQGELSKVDTQPNGAYA